jgi:peptide/nickel transport system permease protein
MLNTPSENALSTRFSLIGSLFTNQQTLAGIVLIAFFALIAILAPLLAPPPDPAHPYNVPYKNPGYTQQMPEGPSAEFPFGTVGSSRGHQYDIYYMLVWGTRTAFRVGLTLTGVTLVIGVLAGIAAGYYGGIVDDALMWIATVVQSFPPLLAALAASAVINARNPLAPGIDVPATRIALVLFSWPRYARLIRGDILAVKSLDYVLAARAIGAGNLRILFFHVLPNAIYSIIAVMFMDIGYFVNSLATLAFLGVGVHWDPDTHWCIADWGLLISFTRHWVFLWNRLPYMVTYPGITITLFILGWSLLGDGFREIVDPLIARPD